MDTMNQLFGSKRQGALSFLVPVVLMLAVLVNFAT